MKIIDLIPVPKLLKQQGSVPADKAKFALLGTVGLRMGVGRPNGDTSQTSPPMPAYKAIAGKKQGTT